LIEPVQLQRELVERLSAFVIAAKDIHFPCFSQGVQFVDEDDAGGSTRCLGKEIAHTDARTPTNISTNADPLMLKKGTCASPATPFARRVLVVPARQQGELLWECSLSVLKFTRILQKLDHFFHLLFGFTLNTSCAISFQVVYIHQPRLIPIFTYI